MGRVARVAVPPKNVTRKTSEPCTTFLQGDSHRLAQRRDSKPIDPCQADAVPEGRERLYLLFKGEQI